MTDDYKALTILRNSVVDGIQAAKLNDISKFFQLYENQVEIPFVGKHQVANVLKKKYSRIESLDRIYEDWKTIASIVHPLLLSTNAERLTGGATNDYVGNWIFKAHFKLCLCAFPF